MYDKTPYTPGMREVIKLSKAEAGRLGNHYIGPEHYLLGIIRKGDGLAIQVLQNLDIDLEILQAEIERNIPPDNRPDANFSPNQAALHVIEDTKVAAKGMKHNWIGTEHLLLGLVSHGSNIAATCLAKYGVTLPVLDEQVLAVIEGSNSVAASDSPADSLNPPPRYTTGLDEVIATVTSHVTRLHDGEVRPVHFLITILHKGNGPAIQVLRNLGVDTHALLAQMEAESLSGTNIPGESSGLDNNSMAVLREMKDMAKQLNHNWIGTEHMLLAILKIPDSPAKMWIQSHTISFDAVYRQVQRVSDGPGHETIRI